MSRRTRRLKKEQEYEEYYNRIDNIPDDPPIKKFDILFETNNLNFELNNEKNIVFFILFHNDLEMLKRTIDKLKYKNNHHFLINICPDINPNVKSELINYFNKIKYVSILYCGYINYPASTELKIIWSIKEWLLGQKNWDFLICLGQSDYSLFSGSKLNNLIGEKTWCSMDVKKYKKEELIAYKDLLGRFINGIYASENKKKSFRRKDLWLYKFLGNIEISWGLPLSSGGIFSRETVKYLINNKLCKIIYMFCLYMSCAAVEHYWHTCFQLDYFKDKIYDKKSCHMEWARGRPGQIPGTSNTFLTLSEWDIIENEYKKGTPFIRKFNSKLDKEILDKIDLLN